MAQQDWYTSFFHGSSLRAWHNLCPPEFTEQETEWILAFLEEEAEGNEAPPLPKPLRILDVPCGNARHIVALAAEGHECTGIDIATENIEIGKAALKKNKLKATLRQEDALGCDFGTGYDAVLCLGNSLGYFPLAQTRAFVLKMGAALRPGGKLFIATGMLAESILPNLEENDWYPAGELFMLLQNQYVLEESRLDTTLTFINPGQPADVRQLHHYVFTFGQLNGWLADAGLSIVDAAEGPGGEPFQFGSEGLYLVAEKTAA